MSVALRSNYQDRSAQRPRMVVATKTVTVKEEDGTPCRLVAGQDRVLDGHWLTRTYPDLFAPESEASKYRSKRSSGRGDWRARLNLPDADDRRTWKPLVRLDIWAAPTFTVRLSRRAWDTMTDTAYAERLRSYRLGADRIHETGGGLFGIPARDSDDIVTVQDASKPGPATRATASTVHVDLDHIRAEDAALERMGSDRRWIGCWHTHTTTSPSDDAHYPSSRDLQFFAADCREWRLAGRSPQHYIAFILTPTWEQNYRTFERYVSWIRPQLHAWHMQAVADDQFICTPAKVVR
jgi:hypothetical protein